MQVSSIRKRLSFTNDNHFYWNDITNSQSRKRQQTQRGKKANKIFHVTISRVRNNTTQTNYQICIHEKGFQTEH
jgi:hypothetical protein